MYATVKMDPKSDHMPMMDKIIDNRTIVLFLFHATGGIFCSLGFFARKQPPKKKRKS